MKHQYFGDVNDYRKYGLLRALTSVAELSLGIIWLLTPDDQSTDGEFRKYLQDPARFRACDPPLHDALRRLLEPSAVRSLAMLEAWDILPGARQFCEVVPEDSGGRVLYLKRAQDAVAGSDLVFFDPDTGIETESIRFGTPRSSKYVYWRELERTYAAGASVVVYQHFRRTPRDQFVTNLVAQMFRRLSPASVHSYCTAHVALLLACQPRHDAQVRQANAAVAARWRGQIDHCTHGPV